MPVKHFSINPNRTEVSKESLNEIRETEEKLFLVGDEKRFQLNKEILDEDDDLNFVKGRVIVKIDDKSKDSHTFQNGMTIRLERRFNNLNLRQTNPVNCHVISSEYIPKGSEILVHFNSIHDSSKIFNYKENNSDVKYYSIKEDECFAYYHDDEWQPLRGFDFALRLFKPYQGLMQGIDPTIIDKCLYVTTGELKGSVVRTLVACDFEVIFQGQEGREESIIRFRPFGDGKDKEPEAVCIDHYMTEKVNNGKLLIGITIKDAHVLYD